MAIALVLIATIIFGGPILEGFGDLFDQAWNLWRNLWGDLTDGDGQSFSTFAVTLHYTDGTSRTIEPEGATFLLPLFISDEGGQIDWIAIMSKVTVFHRGYVDAWDLDGNFKSKINADAIATQVNGMYEETTYTESGPSWNNGETKSVYQATYLATEIEQFLRANGQTTGYYTFVFGGRLDLLTLSFDDGNSESVGYLPPHSNVPAYTCEWNFRFGDSGIDSVSITIATASF